MTVQLRVESALLGQVTEAIEMFAPPRLAKDRDLPESGRMMSIRIRISVLLPAPFGPSRPKISPACTSKETPRSAGLAVALLIPSNVRMVARRYGVSGSVPGGANLPF